MSIVDEARELADAIMDYVAGCDGLSKDAATTLRELADIVARLPVDRRGEPVVDKDIMFDADGGRWVVSTTAIELRNGDVTSLSSTGDPACFQLLKRYRPAAEAAARLANGPHDHDHREDA